MFSASVLLKNKTIIPVKPEKLNASQFKKYGIKYNRVSGTKYLASEKARWKHLIADEDYNLLVPIAANAITHLDFLKRWYVETDEPYVLLMEDDYDLGLIP